MFDLKACQTNPTINKNCHYTQYFRGIWIFIIFTLSTLTSNIMLPVRNLTYRNVLPKRSTECYLNFLILDLPFSDFCSRIRLTRRLTRGASKSSESK
ncbi:unnamed protein product, partial [Nesidiocoris tenuis]